MKSKKYIELIISFILILIILNISGIGCPIHFFSGINCPGCGMTRAYYALLSGDVYSAFYYHPLFFIVPIWILILCVFYNQQPKFLILFRNLTVVLFLVVYAVRLLSPECTIITIDIKEGFIFRIINKFITFF